MKLILTLLFLSLNAYSASNWNDLLKVAIANGTPFDTPEGTFMRFSHIYPVDKTKPHQADYFSPVGGFSNGEFHASWVSMASETWEIDSTGNWFVDIWMHHVSSAGELLTVHHVHLKETLDGRVLEHKYIPTGGAKDPLEIERWQKKLSDWYEFALKIKITSIYFRENFI